MKAKTQKTQPRYRMLVEWSEEDGVFIARAPAFPYVAAHGDTEVEAVRELRIAVGGVVESMRQNGDPIPPPETRASFSGQMRLRMPASFHRLLSSMAEFENISLNTLMVELLAEAAGWRSANAGRDRNAASIASETPARYLTGTVRKRRRRNV